MKIRVSKTWVAALAACGISAATGVLHADTAISWNAGSNGNWNTAANWSPAAVPNGAYAVTLGSFASGYTVTLDTSPTVDSVTVSSSATLATNAGTNLTTGSLSNAGLVNLSSGGQMFHVNGAVTNSGILNVSSTAGGATTLTITGSVDNSKQFYTSDYYDGGNTANNIVNVSGTFTNEASSTVYLQGAGDTLNIHSLVNNGTVQLAAGTILNINGGGSGITDVATGAQIQNGGAINVINSTVSTNALAKLTNIEGTLNLYAGGNTAVTPTGGTLNISSTGDLNLSATTVGSSLTITGNLTNGGQIYTEQSYNGAGTGNVYTISGTFTNSGSGAVRLQGLGDTLNASVLSNSGYIAMSAGTVLNITGGGSGVTDVVGGSQLQIGGAINVINSMVSTNALAKLTNIEGTLNLYTGGNTAVTPTGGTLNISSTGNLNLSATTVGSSLTITGNLTNGGQIYTEQSYNGAGTGNVYTISGTFTNSASGAVRLQGLGDTLNASVLSNSGYIAMSAGTVLNITGGGSGVTDVVGGSQLQIGGAINVINSMVSTNALAKLTNIEGTLNLYTGGNTAVTPTGGTLNISSTGDLNLSATTVGSSLTITGNLTNGGQIYTEQSYNGAGTGNVYTISGTFTNSGSGAVRLQGLGDTLNASVLSNSGYIAMSAGTVLNITGGGSGVTDVVGGSQLQIGGAINVINSMVSTNALAKLTNIEGTLNLYTGGNTAVTPTGGTLNISSTGNLNLSATTVGSSLTITGNLTNGNLMYTEESYDGGGTGNVYTITGTFTNSASGALRLQGPGDTLNASMLSNSGYIALATGSVLNITGGGNGITDVVGGSQLQIGGAINVISGGTTTNALAKLTNIEGYLNLFTGGNTAVTPTGGTLALSSTGNLNLSATTVGSSLTVTGSLTNGGQVYTEESYDGAGTGNIYTISGAFTNSAGALLHLQGVGDTMNVNSMVNDSNVYINAGGTLNVAGNLADNGTITVNANLTTGTAVLKLNGGTLSGTGTVILDQNGVNAQINGAFTQAAGHPIEGQGEITGAMSNLGVLNSNVSGGAIVLSGGLTQYSAGTLSAGTYEVSQNATLDLGTAAITTIGTNVTVILSGTAAAMPQIDFLPNVAGSVTANQGTFELLASRSYSGTGEFNNSGTLQLAGSTFAAGGGITNSASGVHTIEGFGTISSTLTNQGLVTSNVAGDNLVLAGLTTNTGSLVATNGGSIQIVPGLLTNLSGTTLTGGTYEADAGSTLSVSGTAVTNNATVILSGAGSVFAAINSIAVNNGSFQVEAGRSFTTLGSISGTGSVDVGAGAMLNVSGSFNQSGATTIEGSMAIAGSALNGGPGNRNPNATTNVVGSLTIAGGATPTGTLNLNNNIMIVENGGAAGRDAAQADIAFARNGGAWNRPGITSSNAQATFAGTGVDSTTLGVVLNGDLPIPYTTFSGKTVGLNDLLIAYTYGGDANLDGSINGNDYFEIDRGFLNHDTGWVNGDFNYDGSVNGNDYFIIDSNFLAQSGQLAASEVLAHAAEFGPSYLSQFTPAQLAVIGVPEPASLALLGLGAMGLLARGGGDPDLP